MVEERRNDTRFHDLIPKLSVDLKAYDNPNLTSRSAGYDVSQRMRWLALQRQSWFLGTVFNALRKVGTFCDRALDDAGG